MPDFTLPPCSTAIVGMTGSGKTTFAFLHMAKTPCACRFIFDDMGQASARLGIPLVSTPSQVAASLPTKWIAYNPHVMFPGDVKSGFLFFCEMAFKISQKSRHKKIVCIDEAWRFCDREDIPKEFAMLSQMGRSENIELVTVTQEPHRMNSSVLGSATELVCFRLQESIELKKIQGLGADAVAVSRLPLGSLIAYNRVKMTQHTGKLF